MKKQAKAAVEPVRQRTQYSCMSASMAMCLRALDHDVTEDEVNRVMGARPMKGAAWEQALACAQHYGCRATLTMPATVEQLKAWTDAGIPIMIAWNPEGRPWSHASVVFDVDDDLNVYVADPNIPNPKETVRVVPEDEFYHKWFEQFPDYLVRRPACAIEREVTAGGKQITPTKTASQGTTMTRTAAGFRPSDIAILQHPLPRQSAPDVKPRTEVEIVNVKPGFTPYGPKEIRPYYTIKLPGGWIVKDVAYFYFESRRPKKRDLLDHAFKQVMKAVKSLKLKRETTTVRSGRSLWVPTLRTPQGFAKEKIPMSVVSRMISSIPQAKGSRTTYVLSMRSGIDTYDTFNLTLHDNMEGNFTHLTLFRGDNSKMANSKMASTKKETPTQAAIWDAWDHLQGTDKIKPFSSFLSQAEDFIVSVEIAGLDNTPYHRLAQQAFKKLRPIKMQSRSWRTTWNNWLKSGRMPDMRGLAKDLTKTLNMITQIQQATWALEGIKKSHPDIWGKGQEIGSIFKDCDKITRKTVTAFEKAIKMTLSSKTAKRPRGEGSQPTKMASYKRTPLQVSIRDAWDHFQGTEKISEYRSFLSESSNFLVSVQIVGLDGTPFHRLAQQTFKKVLPLKKQSRTWRTTWNTWDNTGRVPDMRNLAKDLTNSLNRLAQIQRACWDLKKIKTVHPDVWDEIEDQYEKCDKITRKTVTAFQKAIKMTLPGRTDTKMASNKKETPTQVAIWDAWDHLQGTEKIRPVNSFLFRVQDFIVSIEIAGLDDTPYHRRAQQAAKKLLPLKKQSRTWRATYNYWLKGQNPDMGKLSRDLTNSLNRIAQIQRACWDLETIKKTHPDVWERDDMEDFFKDCDVITRKTVTAFQKAIKMTLPGRTAKRPGRGKGSQPTSPTTQDRKENEGKRTGPPLKSRDDAARDLAEGNVNIRRGPHKNKPQRGKGKGKGKPGRHPKHKQKLASSLVGRVVRDMFKQAKD